jgi:hypothetical protein
VIGESRYVADKDVVAGLFKTSIVDLGNNVPCTPSNAFFTLKWSEIKF